MHRTVPVRQAVFYEHSWDADKALEQGVSAAS